jgi:hypothetical protein
MMTSSPWLRVSHAVAVVSLLACCLAFAHKATSKRADDARKSYALIFGTVFDSRNHIAPGIKVKIRRAKDKKAKWDLVSDRQGEFAQRFSAGAEDYVVWADLKDKTAAAKTEVKVHVDGDERQDIALHIPASAKSN